MHGDFRLDNLVVAEADARVLCVLDCELATLGDPLADLATNCSAYLFPQNSRSCPVRCDPRLNPVVLYSYSVHKLAAFNDSPLCPLIVISHLKLKL